MYVCLYGILIQDHANSIMHIYIMLKFTCLYDTFDHIKDLSITTMPLMF